MSLIPSFFGGRRNEPFSFDVWDPLENFPSSLFFPRPEFSNETTQFANTRIDWKETPEAHVFQADVPGIKKEEVKVEIEEGRVLQISGVRSKEKEEKDDTWHRVERSSGSFLRRFNLPQNANVDQVKASMENGVLTVTIPKQEVKKPEVNAIEISGATQGTEDKTSEVSQAADDKIYDNTKGAGDHAQGIEDKTWDLSQAAKDKTYEDTKEDGDRAQDTKEQGGGYVDAAKEEPSGTDHSTQADKEKTGGLVQGTAERVKNAAAGAADAVKHTLGMGGTEDGTTGTGI